MVRSGNGVTLTVSVLDVLLVVLLSEHVQATADVLFRLAPTLPATLTVSVMAALPLAAIAVVLVQVTACPTAEHENPPPEPLTNVSPAGSVSVTVMVPLEAPLPGFDTVRVYWAPFCPWLKPAPTCALAMVRSGNCVTFTTSVFEVLLLVLPSMQVHATTAELLSVDGAFAATF